MENQSILHTYLLLFCLQLATPTAYIGGLGVSNLGLDVSPYQGVIIEGNTGLFNI